MSKYSNFTRILVSLQELLGFDYQTIESIKRGIRNFGFTKKRQLEFIQDLASWLNDGCNPIKACEAIIGGAQGQRSLIHEYRAAQSIRDALASGRSIADGMVDIFQPDVVSIFSAGQAAGEKALTMAVNAYLKQQEDIKQARKDFFKPILAPGIYIVIAFLALIFLGAKLLPQFERILGGGYGGMPWSASLTMGIADAMMYFPYYAVFGLILWLVAANFTRNNTSSFRISADNYFPLNIYKAFVAMRVLKTLGILVGSNNTPTQAAAVMQKHSEHYIKYHLQQVINSSAKGNSELAVLLDTGLLSKRLLFRLAIGSGTDGGNSKQQAIQNAADRSGDEAIASLAKTRVTLVLSAWALLGFIMLLLGLSFLSVFTSIFSMYQ